MAQTTVLLREDVDNLGARGEIVKVKAGYARNYLLPRKLAVEATAGNVKRIEAERTALMKKEARERPRPRARPRDERLRLEFERKVGEHGILYGSVTSMDIAEALKAKGTRSTAAAHHAARGDQGDGRVQRRRATAPRGDGEIPVIVTGEGGAQTAGAAAAAPTAEAATPASEAEEATPEEAATDATEEANDNSPVE